MSKIAEFFEKVEQEIKTVDKDIAAVFTKLFGANALSEIETAAETLLKSDLGQAVLSDAEALFSQVKNGTISQVTAIEQLAKATVAAAAKTSIAIEQSVATAISALAIGKLSGALKTPAASAPAPAPVTPTSTAPETTPAPTAT